jgi:hypothetical protein
MDSTFTVGIDRRDQITYAARVRTGSGRPQIMALARSAGEDLVNHSVLQDGELVFSVPDSEVMVHRFALESEDKTDFDLKTRFELAHCLLDDEADFVYDTVPGDSPRCCLGVVMRRKRLDTLMPARYPGLYLGPQLGPCRPRGVALGYGYLGFCRPAGGEFVCLADFAAHQASLCFVYKGRVIGTGYLGNDHLNIEDAAGLRRLGIEFKTVVSFQSASLFERGVSVPLSRILITGDTSGRIAEELAGHFTAQVDRPRINPGFFSDPARTPDRPLGDYLVALGLTIEEGQIQ